MGTKLEILIAEKLYGIRFAAVLSFSAFWTNGWSYLNSGQIKFVAPYEHIDTHLGHLNTTRKVPTVASRVQTRENFMKLSSLLARLFPNLPCTEEDHYDNMHAFLEACDNASGMPTRTEVISGTTNKAAKELNEDRRYFTWAEGFIFGSPEARATWTNVPFIFDRDDLGIASREREVDRKKVVTMRQTLQANVNKALKEERENFTRERNEKKKTRAYPSASRKYVNGKKPVFPPGFTQGGQVISNNDAVVAESLAVLATTRPLKRHKRTVLNTMRAKSTLSKAMSNIRTSPLAIQVKLYISSSLFVSYS
ncbi:hypothetical protein EJ08DRAFT_262029 [Tothia fuscella]|uniref:Uncharacterized protein n=1 Tax=Tothia fuscella TaxID=1048955 RepID=A0A9P4NR90_9PEZI|nr:hypothetical protein EJ08DRAFT_262029 [Tothia fuscella]